MSNFIEYKDRMAFHPGYYIQELFEESGLTQKDFANRLGTTPKNLNVLMSGEQNLSIDIVVKLATMLGTSEEYWFNLQTAWNEILAEIHYDEELELEKEVFKNVQYAYFKENFDLPDLPRKIKEQIEEVRRLLRVASLTVLKKKDLAVNFRSAQTNFQEANLVKANILLQLAVNKVLQTDAPHYNKAKFQQAIEFALTQTGNHQSFFPEIQKRFLEAGVVLVVLPHLPGSKINGATKRVDGKVMIMVDDRGKYADTFWFTLFHEIGHVMNRDFGVSFYTEVEDETELAADEYAQNTLIPSEKYSEFVQTGEAYTAESIRQFAVSIDRDPGIVLGRLKRDEYVPYAETMLSHELRHKYKVKMSK